MIKHFTATLILVNCIDGKVRVLLHKHKKRGIWLGIGGHVEQNENQIEAVCREAKEEIGTDVTLFFPEGSLFTAPYARELPVPVMVLEELIPRYKDNPEHAHIDFIYFGSVNDPEKITMLEEWRWFSQDDLVNEKLLEEVRILSTRAIGAFRGK